MLIFDSWLVDYISVLAAVFAAAYYYNVIAYSYWTKKNVPQIRPSIPFRDTIKTFSGSLVFVELLNNGYKRFKNHGFCGIYSFYKPNLVVCNPELIKHILTKDFNSFHDHGVPYDIENDPLSANLFNIGGKQWKILRAKLSPTFTSGKIKGMFPLINECVGQLVESVRDESKIDNGSVEMKNLLMRYGADVIGTCAFGINCNSLKNPDSEFHQMGREMLKPSFSNLIQFIVPSIFPKTKRFLTTRRLFPKTTSFFTELMSNTLNYRKENNIERNDFVQLMMKIAEEEKDDKIFSRDVMTAQAIIFFIAGLDNVGHQIGFCLHAMAVDPELQDRVYSEISTVLSEHDGKMSYEAVKQMDLVSRVFDEGMRLYTPAAALMRIQTEDKYLLPGTDVVLEKGTPILIPIQAIHNDADYFPDPKKFDPDRFTEEEKALRHPYTYLPFGEGPRFCIASRFAKLEMSLCFAELVRHFKFEVDPKTDVSMKLETNSFGPAPLNGFWLKVTERNVEA